MTKYIKEYIKKMENKLKKDITLKIKSLSFNMRG